MRFFLLDFCDKCAWSPSSSLPLRTVLLLSSQAPGIPGIPFSPMTPQPSCICSPRQRHTIPLVALGFLRTCLSLHVLQMQSDDNSTCSLEEAYPATLCFHFLFHYPNITPIYNRCEPLRTDAHGLQLARWCGGSRWDRRGRTRHGPSFAQIKKCTCTV